MDTETITISKLDADAIDVIASTYDISKPHAVSCLVGYAIYGAGMTFRQYVASTKE